MIGISGYFFLIILTTSGVFVPAAIFKIAAPAFKRPSILVFSLSNSDDYRNINSSADSKQIEITDRSI